MSEAHAQESGAGHEPGHEETHHGNYTQVYLILLALLVVSVLGPLLEIRAVTLITAFGIACVKAYMVAKNFMHITMARRYVVYLVATCLVFMLLLFAGTAPDVMQAEGTRWEKPAWIAAAQAYADGEVAEPGGGHH